MYKCYIAGKISDLPEEQWRANFNGAKSEVEKLGLTPVCPIDLPHEHDKSWQSHMREDLAALLTCHFVYALRNWKESKGATIEVELAKSLSITVIEQAASDDSECQPCYADRDGDCDFFRDCPQYRDNEPGRSGRTCPLWNRNFERYQ